MVKNFVKYFFAISVWGVFLLSGCNNDLLGLFGSSDLDTRWQARNTFNFLSETDRNISLGDEYSFIVIPDTHINNGNAWGLEKLKDTLEDDTMGDVKFVVICGDITQSGKREDIQKFIDIARSLDDVPCYPVVGNHDIFFGNWTNWKELIGSTCYRVDGDSATLLFLDSANAYLGSKQLDWLEGELKKAKGRVFVFSHVNLFVKNITDIEHFTDVRERARVVSLLKGRCDAMFMGHVHRRIVNELGGVKYITTEDYWGNATYCQVWVSEGGIRWEFKKVNR
jgi:predicted phosphodiesterase